jgi:DNA-binding transcriptional LysR family regulator
VLSWFAHVGMTQEENTAESAMVQMWANEAGHGIPVLLGGIGTAMALHEGGIALLPHHVCQQDLATGRLHKVLPDHPIQPNPFYLISPSREHLAPALRSLMDFVAERLPFA